MNEHVCTCVNCTGIVPSVSIVKLRIMYVCFPMQDSPNAFWVDFERNLKRLGYPQREALRQAAFVYDAVWMAAFALNTTSTQLQSGAVQGANQLEQFNHFLNASLAKQINKVILGAAENTSFQGVSVSTVHHIHRLSLTIII